MDIRNVRKKRVPKKRLFIILLLLFGGIFFLYQIKSYFTANTQEEVWTWEIFSGQQITSHKKWERIKFAGNLTVDNHFPLYTHIITRWLETIGLKSPSINLNDYLWEVEIVWNIIDIAKGVPVVEVEILKLAKPWLIIKENSYLFIKDLIFFDFNEQQQLSANKSGKNIGIYHDKIPIFDVERFLCSKILKDKDCNEIIESYLRGQKEFFNSSRWYTFYKQNNKNWAVFDGNIFGYMFKNIEDDILLDISNMVKIINKDFVLANKKDLIKKICHNTEDKLKNIEFSRVWFNDPYFLVINIEWTTSDQKKCTCNVTFDLWDEWNPKDVQFEIVN